MINVAKAVEDFFFPFKWDGIMFYFGVAWIFVNGCAIAFFAVLDVFNIYTFSLKNPLTVLAAITPVILVLGLIVYRSISPTKVEITD